MRAVSHLCIFVALAYGTMLCQTSTSVTNPPVLNALPTASYPDSTNGLVSLLQDAISAARIDDATKLNSILKEMEIPDYNRWFAETEWHSESWAEAYGKQVSSPIFGVTIKCSLHEYASRNGEIVVRRLNDSTLQQGGMEYGWIHNLRKPVNIYFASWRDEKIGEEAKPQFIGYFIFVEGAFRWYSIIRESEFNGPQGWIPQHSPTPKYPYPPDGRHPGGFVHLSLVIRKDGTVTDVKPNGAVESSSDRKLIKAAVEAVREWHFLPVSNQSPKETHVDDFRIMVRPREVM